MDNQPGQKGVTSPEKKNAFWRALFIPLFESLKAYNKASGVTLGSMLLNSELWSRTHAHPSVQLHLEFRNEQNDLLMHIEGRETPNSEFTNILTERFIFDLNEHGQLVLKNGDLILDAPKAAEYFMGRFLNLIQSGRAIH